MESLWNMYIVQPFIMWSSRQQGEDATVANLGQENTMYYDKVRQMWIDPNTTTPLQPLPHSPRTNGNIQKQQSGLGNNYPSHYPRYAEFPVKWKQRY
jgi:hypothetical protein